MCASSPATRPAATVRAARAADRPQLEALEALFPGDRLSARAWRHLLSRAQADVLVVEEAAGVLVADAVVLYRRGSHRARLYSLVVHPQWGRRGIATALLDAVESHAAARGCRELRLEVRADNAGAIALYRRRGFHEQGYRAAYYDDGVGALRMGKPLPPPVSPQPK
ncbi:GNAT family N-acetyltransferase [Ectothiorhodospiraceae bacterium 2226]|nr:GNAT family N-acetyltransferase [Ectothiorhodospiraceae bacterium 2226]